MSFYIVDLNFKFGLINTNFKETNLDDSVGQLRKASKDIPIP